MLKKSALLVLAVTLVLPACGDDLMVENFNAEDLDNLIRNPTRAAALSAATGLLVAGRNEIEDRNGYISLTGILGRESYNFDTSDPRFITEMLGGPLQPGSRAFGGNIWPERYSNIRLGNLILDALEVLDPAEFPDEEKEAVRGFVKTLLANEFLLVINTRDENGAVIDVDRDPRGEPGALVSKTEVFDHIATLLDEARDHLDNGGSAFPLELQLHTGYDGFDTPPSFRQFNRALAARVEAYRASPACTGCGGDWAEVLNKLAESFLDLGAPLDVGVYHVFSLRSGDQTGPGRSPGNDLFDPGPAPDILAHPSIVADAETNMGGQLDLRVQNKIRQLPDPRTSQDLTTAYAFDIYDDPESPVPIIRHEELILLRAEANFRLGVIGLAADDVNFIRMNSGGLDERTDLTLANFEDELLQQRRYSLMFEGGHRWIDARRMNRLDDLPLDRAGDVLNAMFPIPEEECLARGLEGTPGGGCM